MPRKTKPDDVMRLAVNGHELVGEQYGGQWTFHCKSFTELAGAGDKIKTIEAFMALVLAPAVEFKQLAR